MLSLQSQTAARWLEQVSRDLPAILVDHAHCEKKAAGVALNLLFTYGTARVSICGELSEIVVEELEHFRQVLAELKARDIGFVSQKPGGYGKKLNALVRSGEPMRAVDRFLVASLIEARSCERFALLRDHVNDPGLAEFYGGLFESEARHHSTYVQMARLFASDGEVDQRLAELAAAEARIIEEGDLLPRMHS